MQGLMHMYTCILHDYAQACLHYMQLGHEYHTCTVSLACYLRASFGKVTSFVLFLSVLAVSFVSATSATKARMG
jgi:hypothetical protein